MLFAFSIAFVLAWSALVWGCATSSLRNNDAYSDWPSYWRTQILVAVVPVLFVFVYTVLPTGMKPDLSFIQDFLFRSDAIAAAPAVFSSDMPVLTGQTSIVLPFAAMILFAYFAGLVFCLTHFVLGKIQAARIINDSEFRNELGFWVTSRSVSPFAISGAEPKIVFPERLLAELSPDQAEMIVRHEQAHIDHRDPDWADIFHLIRAAFWFSPFVRDLINRWQVSVELRSDTEALNGEEPESRKAYAESLITALSLSAVPVSGLAASFSNKHLRSEKMRIKNIMRGENGKRHSLRSNVQLLIAASALTLIGCTSAAGVSTAAADPSDTKEIQWVHKGGTGDVDMHKRVFITKDGDGKSIKHRKVVMHKDGEVIERDYEDLSEAERAEIDRELARAEKEIERAMREMDLAEDEIELAGEEIKRVIRIHKGDMDIDVDVEAELENARIEIEIAREEVEKAREELEQERERLENSE